jgi:hypothetical protein
VKSEQPQHRPRGPFRVDGSFELGKRLPGHQSIVPSFASAR